MKRSFFQYTQLAFATVLVSLTLGGCHPTAKSSDKIEQLISTLTLEEKVGQLNLIPIEGKPTEAHLQLIREGKVGGVLKSNGVAQNTLLQKIAVEESHCGIPILFQEDVIHGYRTITPIPLGEAASWDIDMIGQSAALAAREMSAAGVTLTYAPMVDVARDPRWGRILETSGEDPTLGSRIAAARVKGFQAGNEEAYHQVLACVKHFAGYGASLAGRDYNIQEISERELRETHLPPFQAAIDAGVASLMCAYTMYNGEPLTASDFLLKQVLRDEMGFKGAVMTDWATISNLRTIGICDNDTASVIEAINSGIDIDMTSETFLKILPQLVREGKVSEALVDNALRNVLQLKEQAGLLDDPYKYLNSEREAKELLSDENKQIAKEMALKSMVLLKNSQQLLPINRDKVKSIAVIGPLAEARHDLLGWWAATGRPDEVTTIREAIAAEFGSDCTVRYAAGCAIDSFRVAGREMIPAAVALAKASDMVVMVLGENYWMSGEGGGVASLQLPSAQLELLERVAQSGTPIATIVVTGRPYVLTQVDQLSDAVLQAWMPGTMGGEAVADIIAGHFNPCGKLPVTYPLHEGQVPFFYSYKRTSHSLHGSPQGSRYTTTYRDVESRPLYPFGYGLSYTTFAYNDLRLDSTTLTSDGAPLTATVKVTNSGKVKGREVVQLYIADEVCQVVRPERELKDFTIVELAAGESKEVSFRITPSMLTFIGKSLQPTLEAGSFKLYVGGNSQELLQCKFTLED